MKPDGAEAMITRLYERHYDEVLAYCTRRVGRIEADDVAADVFAVAWRRIDDIDWETTRPWLFGVARGVLANRWRSARRRQKLFGRVSGLAPIPRELPDDRVVRRGEDEEVRSAVRRLNPADREVLMLAAWEGLTSGEIALALGVSVAAAQQRLSRAKARLARVLRPPVPHPDTSPRAAEERGPR